MSMRRNLPPTNRPTPSHFKNLQVVCLWIKVSVRMLVCKDLHTLADCFKDIFGTEKPTDEGGLNS